MQQAPKSLSRLKELARKHKRAHSTTHDEALEHVAREFGYRSYNEAQLRLQPPDEATATPPTPTPLKFHKMELLPSPFPKADRDALTFLAQRIVNRDNTGIASVETSMLPVQRSLARSVFHRIRIGTHVWALCIGRDGDLYVEVQNTRSREVVAANWGFATSIAFLESAETKGANDEPPQPGVWHLAKYGNQPLCSLATLTIDEIVEGAYQFGLHTPSADYDRLKLLWNSPAFASLSEAAATALSKGRPLVAGDSPKEPGRAVATYFGEWHLRALRRADCDVPAELEDAEKGAVH